MPSDEHQVNSIPAPTPPTLPLETTPFDVLLEGYANHLADLCQPEVNTPSKAVAQNIATSGAWEALLPKLVYPLMEQEHARRRPNAGPSELPRAQQCSCLQQNATVLVVSFTSMCIRPTWF